MVYILSRIFKKPELHENMHIAQNFYVHVGYLYPYEKVNYREKNERKVHGKVIMDL